MRDRATRQAVGLRPSPAYCGACCLHVLVQVLQRGLPRPATLDLLPQPRPDEQLPRLSMRELAEELLHRWGLGRGQGVLLQCSSPAV